MRRKTVAVAAILGLLAVSAGAFGAHALAGRVPPERIDTFRLAAHYQLIHAVVLVALGLAGDRLQGRALDVAIASLFAGVLVFSGSLYILVLSGQGFWGAITPVGGILLHAGWAGLLVAVLRVPRSG